MAASFGRLLTAIALAAFVAGCAPQTSSKIASLDRPIRPDYLQLVSVSDRLVEVDSAGRIVRAAAPKGLCISTDSIQTFGDSVFMVVEGCGDKLAGVVSISVSNQPFSGDFSQLECLLQTRAGRISLGYGGDAGDIELIGLRRQDGALYAMVQDMSEFGPAFAGDEICRVFTELNGRMAVVSILSRRAAPVSADELAAEISALVQALKAANA